MAGLGAVLMGGLQLIAGIFLLATGVGGGLGIKLVLAGGLSLITTLLSGQGRTGLQNDARYGFDNAQNTTTEGGPIPVIFGRERFAPPIISVLFDTNGSTEVLKYLCLVGEGEISAINDVRLNGSPAASLGATIATRLGTADQTVIPGFERTGAAYTAGAHLGRWTDCTPSPACGEYVFDMKAAADELVLRFNWNGLYHVNNDGTTKASTAVVSVAWKAMGAPDSTYKYYRVPVVAGVRQSGDWRNQYNADWWTLTKESRVAVRASMRLPFILDNAEGHPGPGRYTIRVRGEAVNDTNDPTREPDLVGWNEITDAPAGGGFSYANMALIAVTIPASSTVSGAIPKTDALIDGLLLYDFRTGLTRWSRNPVLAVYACITNPRWGIGDWLTGADCGPVTFPQMANRCDELLTLTDGRVVTRYELDLVMATKADVLDWTSQILAGCRMEMSGLDGYIQIYEDREQASVADFDERAERSAVAPPPGEAPWALSDSAPVSMGMGTLDTTPTVPRWNILADPESGVSSLVVRQNEESTRYTEVLIKYTDRDQSLRNRSLVLYDLRLNVAGAITGGPLLLGEQIKGQTSGVVGWLTNGYATGARLVTFVVQPGDSFEFEDGETVEGMTSGATFVASGSGYAFAPARRLEIQLYGVTTYWQILQMARYHLGNAQFRTLTASWGFDVGEIDLMPGSVVRIYSTRYGWYGKAWTILSMAYDQFGKGRIEAREYSEAPFALVDRIPAVPYAQPGGAVAPGLRAPDDKAPSAASGSSSGASSSAPPSGGGGTGGGAATQKPANPWWGISLFGKK